MGSVAGCGRDHVLYIEKAFTASCHDSLESRKFVISVMC